MFNTTTISFAKAIAKIEIDTFIKKYKNSFSIKTENFKNGNVLFRTIPNKASFLSLLTHSKVVTKRSLKKLPAHQCYKPLFEDVSKAITTITTPMDLPTAIQSIAKIKNALKQNFYGALLINKELDIKINPLHPLTAMSLISEDTPFEETTKWTLIIFAYKSRTLLDNFYRTKDADLDIINENINSQIHCYINKVSTTAKTISFTPNDNRTRIAIKYKLKKSKDESIDEENLLVTHQLLTAGIVIPYYGTSIIKMSSSTTGINVTPMISSNISHNTKYHDGTSYDSHLQEGTPTPIYASVCTGQLDNQSLDGLRSLTHSNTLSPYNRAIIVDGALAYVDACNKKSLEIFQLAKLIPQPEPQNAPISNPDNENSTTSIDPNENEPEQHRDDSPRPPDSPGDQE